MKSNKGFTLIEILMTFSILLTTIAFLLGGMLSFNQTNDDTINQTSAMLTAKSMVEIMQETTFSQVYASYNTDANDDPNGVGTAPGDNFDVEGLSSSSADIDNKVGKVLFPTKYENGQYFLREDPDDPELAMDLNGNGVIDAGVNITDYKLLPIKIEIRWEDIDKREKIYTLTAILRE